MLFGRKKRPRISPEEALAAKPVRLTEAEAQPAEGGGARLTVTLRPTGLGRMLLRMPKQASKTFELDAIGLFVWEHCDGKTSVRQIITRLAKRFHLNLREAQVPTMKFLETLARRGLIGMARGEERS